MQSQPVITEEAYTSQKTHSELKTQKKQEHQVPQKSNKQNPIKGQTFFEVMDIVDEYDQMLKQMNDFYTEGIMAIAHVKFINPYTSLSTKGYKPTPAITKLQIRQNEEFSLVSCLNPDLNFTNSVIESIQNEKQQFQVNLQNESQEQVISQANSSLSTAHQLYSFDEEQLIMQEQQTVQQCRNLIQSKKLSKQDFIMERFSLLNQQSIAAQGMQNFTTLLNKLLEIAQFKLKTNSKFKTIQQNST